MKLFFVQLFLPSYQLYMIQIHYSKHFNKSCMLENDHVFVVINDIKKYGNKNVIINVWVDVHNLNTYIYSMIIILLFSAWIFKVVLVFLLLNTFLSELNTMIQNCI